MIESSNLSQLSEEKEKLELYWRSFISHLTSPQGKIDLGYIWTGKVKKDFENIKKESGKITLILGLLHKHYKNKKQYEKEIEDIKNLLRHISRVKPSGEWIRKSRAYLQQIILDIENERKFISINKIKERIETEHKEKYFDISREPYGKFLVTSVGMSIIQSNISLTESILNSLYRRILDLEKIGPKQQTSGWELSRNLRPHLDNVRFRYVGEGAEGQVLQFYYPGTNVMIKFYNFDPNHLEGRGIGLFLKLLKVPIGTKYYTPEPYFATNFLCAMQDFSSFPDYFTFIKKYPEEKKRLDKYLKQLIKEDPVEIDVTQIVHPEDRTSEDKASIFIVKYNPKAKKNEDRFKIGGVDLI